MTLRSGARFLNHAQVHDRQPDQIRVEPVLQETFLETVLLCSYPGTLTLTVLSCLPPSSTSHFYQPSTTTCIISSIVDLQTRGNQALQYAEKHWVLLTSLSTVQIIQPHSSLIFTAIYSLTLFYSLSFSQLLSLPQFPKKRTMFTAINYYSLVAYMSVVMKTIRRFVLAHKKGIMECLQYEAVG